MEQELDTTLHQQDRLKPFTLQEIKNDIKKLNHKKAPGIDLITATMLKELPQKGLLNLLYIVNAIIRLEYWPKSLKQAQIIMLPKPGKNPTDVSSYRPISLLPTISKILEKLILKIINKETGTHKTGFQTTNSASDRLTQQFNNALVWQTPSTKPWKTVRSAEQPF